MQLRSIRGRMLALCLMMALWLGSGLGTIPTAIAETATISPKQTETTPLSLPELQSLFDQAIQFSQAGDFDRADQQWSELLEQLPDNAALWSNRGNVRVAQNRLPEAIEDYNRAIELAPNQPNTYLNRGTALEGLAHWDAAIADYNQVLTLNPQEAAAYNNRGNAQAGQGHWPEALADYHRAIELQPRSAIAQVNYALTLYQTEQTAASLQTLRQLTRQYPNFADARAAFTAALWQTGQAGAAESNWVAAIGLDPRYQDLTWVRQIRRWPPRMVSALEAFLQR